VTDIAAGDIEPAPSFGAHIRTEFIAGMGRLGDQFIVILDPDRVLSLNELDAVTQAVEGCDIPS